MLSRLLAQRRARRRLASLQRRAWRVQDVLVSCGLSQSGVSIVGGQFFDVPHVVWVEPGTPERLTIRIPLGQMPSDYDAQAPRIAYNLGVNSVRVYQLPEPRMILLELL